MNWMAGAWRATVATVAIALVVSWTAPEAQALAVGRITVHSALGQPLKAEVDILNIDAAEAASLKAGIAAPEAFRAAGMEYHAVLQNLKVAIVRRSDGRTVLELSTDRPINEPFIDLILETSWATGRLLRGYTLLFDPPKLPAPESVAAVLPRVSPVAPAAAPATATVPIVAAPSSPPLPTPLPSVRPAATAPRSEAARQITVQRGDTASRIAAANKPTNLSLDQMLVALLQANPAAFIDGNLNRLKAGAVLDLPSAEQRSANSPREARQILIAQSRDYAEFRRKLAETAPASQTAAASRQATGTVTTKLEDKKVAGAPDKLTLSKGTTQASAEADKASQDRAAKEAAARVAELSKNIADLNKVKGSMAAASAPGAAAVGSTVAVAPTPAPAPVAAPAPAAAVTPAVVAVPATAPQPKAEPKPEPSLIDDLLANPMMLGAGALLLLLLGAVAAMVSRRRKAATTERAESRLESRLQPESFFKATGQSVDTHAAPAGSSMMYSPSQLDSGGDVDPVAEADVYLAYGRDIQAEEILREALRLNPTRLAIHAKLLEIYAKRRDEKAFATVAKDAFDLSEGKGSEWNAICMMGRQLDPSNSMYQPAGSAASARVEPSIGNAVPVAAPARLTEPATPAATPTKSAIEVPAVSVDEAADVLDLDAEFAAATAEMPAQPLPDKSAGKSSGTKSPDPVAPAALGAKDLASDATDSEVQDLMKSLDFDAGTSAKAVPVAAGPTVASSTPAGMIEFDMGGLSLDLDSPAPAAPTAPAPTADMPEDAIATKLALAEEFQAIGDDEGARTLLEEVIAEASGEVKQRAQQALAKLG